MRLIFTSYASSPEYTDPGEWLKRIEAYTGILESLGDLHEVISIERINYAGEYEKNGVRYYFIKQQNKVSRFPFQAHRLIRRLQPDVVFINGFIFPLQIIQLRMQLGSRVKIIILHRAEKPFPGFKKYWQQLADKCVDAYFFSAPEFGASWIRSGITKNHEKFYEIVQGSSVFESRSKEEARKSLRITGGPVYLWIGRLDANKDPLTVIRAFFNFHRLEPAARLYMIYQQEELIDEVRLLLARYAAVNAPVRLIGTVSHADIGDWLNAADFIISGSHYEGSGIAVCEAMSCGCIPVVTDIPSFRIMTGNGDYGFLYEAGNADTLLEVLLRSTQLDIAEMQWRVKQHFQNEFSFAAIARKTNAAVAELLQK